MTPRFLANLLSWLAGENMTEIVQGLNFPGILCSRELQ